jgi:sphinganine-1-phosphate aldolase
LPFMELNGETVAPWDFRVPGVTTISADVHKLGYAPKGASVILHRDPDWFAHQVFLYDQWPSGMYGSPGVAGARSAAPIATAWAVLQHLGWDGYVDIMREVMATTAQLRAAIVELSPLAIVGDPIGPVLACTSTDEDVVDIGGVGDAMDHRGWHLNRIVDPPGLHLMLSPAHARVVDALIADLVDCVAHHDRARPTDVRYS